jgi:hypothetical protein
LIFPIDFLPANSVGLFHDFSSAPQICKSFIQSALRFSLAEGVPMRECLGTAPGQNAL